MTTFLLMPLYGLLSIYVLWIMYLAVMNLMRSRDSGTLSKTAYCLGLPLLYLGLVVDCFVNTFPVSAMFLELPHEWTVTARLSRHIHDGEGWRKTLALWYGANLLDTFDPSGKHLK